MTNHLNSINGPADLKKLERAQLPELADEIRQAILTKVTAAGGHFGPNLGVVEATIALHYVFDSPNDKIVWDVSHQSYPHKILTGRKEAFLDPAHYHDVTGYTHPSESEHDHFVVGHTGTSISMAVGLAKGRDLNGRDENVIAFIGDGSLSEGEALEGLDNAGAMDTNLIIVLNDNEWSIAENHGGMYEGLAELRATNGASERNMFRDFGLDYRYVADGNDTAALVEVFEQVRGIDHPVVVHIHTDKGRGSAWAEENKEAGHWRLPEAVAKQLEAAGEVESVDSVTVDFLENKMKADPTVVAITAATAGSGFPRDFRERVGRQFVDVGIAEQHAIAFASGIGKAGGKPVVEMYSTFMQRAYDQLQQDLALQGNPATIIMMSMGAIAPTDNTHSGMYGIAMANTIPGLTGLAPATREEYLAMLDWSIDRANRPVVIAQPGSLYSEADLVAALGGPVAEAREGFFDEKDLSYRTIASGSKVAILALGDFLGLGVRVRAELKEKLGVDATLIDPRMFSAVDAKALDALRDKHTVAVTLEDGLLTGGFGREVAAHFAADKSMTVLNYGADKEFNDCVPADELFHRYRLEPETIAEDVRLAL
ncbi:1-deoxy-D-xylulose-5-phosphate synthase [Bifidobacterium lemurum]|uniref:1-deoxy-D-xylulose-5-phosphate synthase n=1 Tax=Bifidobacterium lemurum TaxID=1603886 RepID=A0A261FMS5_9BIFI|nr:1-deoxy-D-xylulose-5-phosphate synthase [Bifidobacterium lemurum]OZG60263.1 1-deoxy-D-xylulose-5-phosphate synthase [Bifidobacterium lemurum]QOL34154.1 1-deoxy-D-xylulose-5-phosphate synthase [Bifidobacterium lemurum]